MGRHTCTPAANPCTESRSPARMAARCLLMPWPASSCASASASAAFTTSTRWPCARSCIAIQQVHTTHHFANSLPEAAAMSLRAGTDLDLCGGFTPYLTTAVQTGLVSEAVVDVAVRRLLRARFELGDFDPEHLVGYRRLNHTVADTHHELAREAARQAIVLLENKKETLPLAASQLAGKKVAVLGPCANNTNCQMGDYSPKSDGPIVTPMEAFVARLGAASVLYAPGCPGDAACNGGPCPVSCRCANQSMFAPAAAAAAAADVVIFVGGASGLTEWMGGEASCHSPARSSDSFSGAVHSSGMNSQILPACKKRT